MESFSVPVLALHCTLGFENLACFVGGNVSLLFLLCLTDMCRVILSVAEAGWLSSLMVRILIQAFFKYFLLVIDEVKSLVTVPSCSASETLGWTVCTVVTFQLLLCFPENMRA